MQPVEISAETERRFVLGRQGLWPGRRWQGMAGTIQAARESEGVQLDPLVAVARSQELFLASRVLDYQVGYLDEAAYQQRLFFDYGGTLFLYAMEELPYWMPRMRASEGYWPEYLREHADVVRDVLAALRDRGPLGNRDFTGNKRINSYRGRKDTALALYALWMTGEVMVHHRQGFDRVYDLHENVVPAQWDWSASEAEAEAFFARKLIAFIGILRERGWAIGLGDYMGKRYTADQARAMLQGSIERGLIAPLRVRGVKEPKLVLREDLPLLETLERGEIPAAWRPLGPTTLDEAVILAPLDIVSARGRAAKLFGFEYLWEVYVPEEKRRWGYYNVAILYGDQLVGRLSPRLDRKTATMELRGLWLEDDALGHDPQFAAALAACLRRFQALHNAKAITLDAIHHPALQAMVRRMM